MMGEVAFFLCAFSSLADSTAFKAPEYFSFSSLLTTRDISLLVARNKVRQMYSQATCSFVYVKFPLCLGHPTFPSFFP